jgi:hypothetical protein
VWRSLSPPNIIDKPLFYRGFFVCFIYKAVKKAVILFY